MAHSLTFVLILCFKSFNFTGAHSVSSDYAEFIELPDGALLRTPRCVTRHGGAVRVCPHAQFLDTAPALVSEEKFNKGRVAPAPYVPDKKWKVIRHFSTSNTAQLDP